MDSPKQTQLPSLVRDKRTHQWARDPLDWYVEPEWCSQRLFELEPFEQAVWDPCAGTGRIGQAAHNAGHMVVTSDIVMRSPSIIPMDFLKVESVEFPNIVSNPPYKLAREITEHALKLTFRKVAMFMGANWVQGATRSQWLASTPLKRVLFVCPRPSCPPGQFLLDGGKAGNGRADFVWCIWEHGYKGAPEIGWCRK